MKKIISLALLATACGGAIDQLDAGEDDATAASYALFTVRRDERKCAAPACGGWWATALRTDATPSYVSDLDFSRAHLDDRTESQLRGAPKFGNDNDWNWGDPARNRAVNDYYGVPMM